MARSIGPRLRYYWGWASALPGGKWLFSRLLGLVVPYTGSIGATVRNMEPGHCVSRPARSTVRYAIICIPCMPSHCAISEKCLPGWP